MIKKILRWLFGVRAVAPYIQPAVRELTPDEHREIGAWLDSPTTKFVLSLAEASRPGLFITGSGVNVSSEFDSAKVSNRFHQLQGWQWHLEVIHSLRHPPKKIQPIEESYPD